MYSRSSAVWGGHNNRHLLTYLFMLRPKIDKTETGVKNQHQISGASFSFHVPLVRKFTTAKINRNMVDNNADTDEKAAA